MFYNIFDLAFVRSTKQAFGFYIGHFVIAVLSAFFLGLVAGMIFPDKMKSFDNGVTLGTIIAIIYCLAVSFAVLQKKQMFGNIKYVLLAILGGILAVFGGALLGLIPAAYLTTRGEASSVGQVVPATPTPPVL